MNQGKRSGAAGAEGGGAPKRARVEVTAEANRTQGRRDGARLLIHAVYQHAAVPSFPPLPPLPARRGAQRAPGCLARAGRRRRRAGQ